MTLFGWTVKQWGLVLAFYNVKPKTLKEAYMVNLNWRKRNAGDPVESLTIITPNGDDRPCDYEAACDLFKLI